MNNEEAKFLLQGYRPNGADAGDPAIQEALQQVQRDPALGEWFARQQAFDTAVGAKLKEVAPPAGLREAILAGGRVTAPDRSQARWWRSSAVLAAAAGLAVMFSVGVALWPKPAVASPLDQFALADARQSETHGGHGEGMVSLHRLLANPATRLGQPLALDFDALSKGGCRTVKFQGREVLEVCFERNGVWFHCYVARRADFPALAAGARPVLSEQDDATLATWADAAHVFVVVSKKGRAALEQLI